MAPHAMPTLKSRAARLAKTGAHVENLVLAATDLVVIKGIYANDYSRFGYDSSLPAST
jgi:hypothetical protein